MILLQIKLKCNTMVSFHKGPTNQILVILFRKHLTVQINITSTAVLHVERDFLETV